VANSYVPMLPFSRNASFIGFDASIWQGQKPAEANRDLNILSELFASGTFRTAQPLHVHDISEVENVFRMMQDGKTSGKIVMEVRPDSMVQVSYN